MCGFEPRETNIGKMLPGWVDFLGTLQGEGRVPFGQTSYL